ncbi:hypothetical protein E2562_001891 [Oryza meyeriana var. granulata]|uniref:Uncharacterized protein n=1 Tax=Oryza meyeriana var. granulata TaxID=110450 RepID=A0A6G1C3J3_9ORYZ|nr:hypothetical protein E2562_001891 [Oryza meyeriana var. granulata]
MAVIANDHINPIAGMALIYVDAIFAGGSLRFTIAEACQRHGIEQSAAAVVHGNCNLTKEELTSREASGILSILCAVVLSMACTTRTLYMVCNSNSTAAASDAVLELSMRKGAESLPVGPSIRPPQHVAYGGPPTPDA